MVETIDRRSGAGSSEEGKKPKEVKSEEAKPVPEPKPAEEAKPSPAPEPAPSSESLPKPEFLQLVQMFMYQTMIALGQAPNPMTQQAEVDLDAAKHHIGFLEVLEAKTKGNLSETEEKFLTDCLHQCRLGFVTVSKGPPSEAEKKED